jgi:hypothetical protein
VGKGGMKMGKGSMGKGVGEMGKGGMGKGVGVQDVEVGHGKGSICKLGGVLGVWGTFLEHL